MKPRVISIVQLSVVLLAAATLKLYYSTTNVNGLRWILAPPTLLVELITDATFTFESNAGYMSSDHTFLIATSCSGVNFLITAFLILSLGKLWRCRSHRVGWTFFLAAAMVAYLTTIIANTVRISTAFWLHQLKPDLIWINPEQLHRFEGIFVYFGFLLLLFIFCEKLRSDRESRPKDASEMLRHSFLPLLVYYAVTLGIPLVNGAYTGELADGLWEYSVFVFLIPIFLILLLAAINYLNDQRSVLFTKLGIHR